MTYFRMVKSTLSSALSSFTSEFGMGSGGSYSLLSPGNPVFESTSPHTHDDRQIIMRIIRRPTRAFEKVEEVVHTLTIMPTKRLSVIWSSLTGN